jgi:DNA-binding transcriptional MerR regulator
MLTYFYASEVARLAGFQTVVMLNYLEQSGTFVSELKGKPHHGKWRRYTYRDLVVLRAINKLLEMGARPKRIQQAIETFVNLADLPKDADALATFARKSALFVVTKESVLYCEPEGLVDLGHKGQLAFSFLIDTAQSLNPVATAVARYSTALQSRPRNKASLEQILTEVAY